MKRREFLFKGLGLTCIGALGAFLSACDGGGYGYGGGYGSTDNSSTGGGGSGSGVCPQGTNVVYANPGHAHSVVKLSQAQVLAAVPGNYTLLSGGHSHTFNLTASDFASLKAGNSLTNVAESDGSGHGHLINIVCV